MRRNAPLFLFLILPLFACVPRAVPVTTGTSVPTASATHIAHAPEIRFALIGEPRDLNVWELFDESGASYVDYALRAEYWPRLYQLAPPELIFEPLAAEGSPSRVVKDGDTYFATVRLRPDLKWTDGSAFSAGDVAFTVNTALAFGLGFDWSSYYPRDTIDHVEAPDQVTVKFVFKQKPNVAVWQYAALQGPIVQKAYWEPLVKEASSLLPEDALLAQIEEARAHFAENQARVDDLTAQVTALKLNGQQDRKLEGALAARQNELTFAQNNLGKLLEESDAKTELAHRALYAVDDQDEPTLGTWIPAGKKDGAWVNVANPDFPFIKPNFDRVVYSVFADTGAAATALENDEVDVIVNLNGVQIEGAKGNPTSSARFLAFNPERKILAEPALRNVMACIVHIDLMTSGQLDPLNSFVLNGFWREDQPVSKCSGLAETSRLQNIVKILKDAGYGWKKEPTVDQAGLGLTLPGGEPFPPVLFLTTPPDYDMWRANVANYIETKAQYLGIPLTKQEVDPQTLRYDVFSSKQYDMAILGWNLSLYPGFLCEWFGPQGQFDYGSEKLGSECEALEVETDLDPARQHIFEIQSILMEDLPFIPLYTDIRYDAYRNIHYPFESVLGGYGGLYGAPSFAIPSQ